LSLIEELGERKIIDIILKCLDRMPNMPIPFGDDVSAFDVGYGRLGVIKTDILVGKTDVPAGMSLWQAGRKAVVMNISDFAAKGVQPNAILTSIGLPRGLTEDDVEQISKGLNEGARKYSAYILGGDTSEASDLIISCSVFGIGNKRSLILRSGAKPGDLVAVTGLFGKTASGLKLLTEKISASPQIRKELVDAVLMPSARLNEGLSLAQTNAVTASIDSSDGLAWSLHEISKASHVGFIIDNLPVDSQVESLARINGLDSTELSLYGGEEYELVVTVNPNRWEQAKNALECTKSNLIPIGTVTKEKNLLLKMDGNIFSIEAKGWEHFKNPLK
jgi:thiamine-monophosphate kinase